MFVYVDAMSGRPRQDRASVKAVVVAARFPSAIAALLDALVGHEKNQIEAMGLAGKVNRASLLEALILGKAKQVGLVKDSSHGPTTSGPSVEPGDKPQGGASAETGSVPRSVWDRLTSGDDVLSGPVTTNSPVPRKRKDRTQARTRRRSKH